MITKQNQEKFLQDQLWKATLRAALSRAGTVYKGEPNEKDKRRFRIELFEFVSDLIHKNYQDNTPNEEEHLKNISTVSNFALSFSYVNLRFGHSQKVLNLFLKYLWCLGYIKVPPHFPVDRLIQKKLGIHNPSQWTQWDNPEEYLKVIEHARAIASKRKFETIAELELALYNNTEELTVSRFTK